MSQQELLALVVDQLDQLNIDYMLTGSFASSLQGEPRATHDIDLVVELGLDSCRALIERLRRPAFYVSEDAAARAVSRKAGLFNLINSETGDKVDFWILTGDDFDQVRFRRRQTVKVFGLSLQVSSPEDTILMKLKWARASGGSQKHSVDALRVYEVNLDSLNTEYLAEWVSRLGVQEQWSELLDQAQPI